MASEANDKSNISIGLPKSGGAIYWAPLGTAVPTDAVAALGPAFLNLGYVTEDGLVKNTTVETSNINSWGPEVVGTSQQSFSKGYNFSLLETTKESALKFVYGEDNVTIDGNGAVEIDETDDPLPRGVLVIDTIQNNGGAAPRYKRQIAADAQFVDRSGDETYNNSDPLAYPVNVVAYKSPIAGKQMYVKTYVSALS